MSEGRRRPAAETMAGIVRRHLAGREHVSKLAEEFGVRPGQIHIWIEQNLAQSARALARSRAATVM